MGSAESRPGALLTLPPPPIVSMVLSPNCKVLEDREEKGRKNCDIKQGNDFWLIQSIHFQIEFPSKQTRGSSSSVCVSV